MTQENTESVTYVNAATWEWLMAYLEGPPEPDPRMVELFRRARVYPDSVRDAALLDRPSERR